MSMRKTPPKIDSALQAQVDAQLMEQGAFAALELLIDSGRLAYDDYESWRRRQIDLLDGVLMGSPEKIRAQLEECAHYARSIGLIEQPQEFHAWHADVEPDNGKPLRISADPHLQRLIGSRHVPARDVPQMDLFFDNPVVALTNGVVRALCARNPGETQRLLDQLYARAPNHADLAAFDLLLEALSHLQHPGADMQREVEFLLQAAPVAKRLLGAQSRDLMAPLWKQLANQLAGKHFTPEHPSLHRSFVLSQAQDWSGVSTAVLEEPEWWRHPQLCLHLARSGFYRQRRIEALTAWFHLCWRFPDRAADALENRQQPDSGVAACWQRFLEIEDAGGAGELIPAVTLTAADFPAWMLLHEPGLAQQLPIEAPSGNSPGEEHYRCVHRLMQARRANLKDAEMAQRKRLRADQPLLFQYLIQQIGSVGTP
jgi:hypothetical protein